MPNWSFWGLRASPQPSAEVDPRDNLERPKHVLTIEQEQLQARQRIRFNSWGVEAFGWPSEGGLLVRSVNAVDLQHLNVSRTEPTPRSEPFDSVEEDAWCEKLRQVTPMWYCNRDDWLLQDVDGRLKTAKEIEKVFVAWPDEGKSGVWLLKFEDGRTPNGFGAYNMCINMAERCEVLKIFGAKYQEDPEQCFELTKAYIKECRRQRDELDM